MVTGRHCRRQKCRPRQSDAGCARRRPIAAPEDAGSNPATSKGGSAAYVQVGTPLEVRRHLAGHSRTRQDTDPCPGAGVSRRAATSEPPVRACRLDPVEELLTAPPSILGGLRELGLEVSKELSVRGAGRRRPLEAGGAERPPPPKISFENFCVPLCLAGHSLCLVGTRCVPLDTTSRPGIVVTPRLHGGRPWIPTTTPCSKRSSATDGAHQIRRLLGSGRSLRLVPPSDPAPGLRRLRSRRGADRDLLERLAPRRRRPQGVRLTLRDSLPVVRRRLPGGFPPPRPGRARGRKGRRRVDCPASGRVLDADGPELRRRSTHAKAVPRRVTQAIRGPAVRTAPVGVLRIATGRTTSLVGTPLCLDCYDYEGAVLQNAHTPELWRRTMIYTQRQLAAVLGRTQADADRAVRLSFCRVAEFQRRGVVHLHAVVRADGPDGSIPPVDAGAARPRLPTGGQAPSPLAHPKGTVHLGPADRRASSSSTATSGHAAWPSTSPSTPPRPRATTPASTLQSVRSQDLVPPATAAASAPHGGHGPRARCRSRVRRTEPRPARAPSRVRGALPHQVTQLLDDLRRPA